MRFEAEIIAVFPKKAFPSEKVNSVFAAARALSDTNPDETFSVVLPEGTPIKEGDIVTVLVDRPSYSLPAVLSVPQVRKSASTAGHESAAIANSERKERLEAAFRSFVCGSDDAETLLPLIREYTTEELGKAAADAIKERISYEKP